MRTSQIKLLGLAALIFSTTTNAVGLSGITVTSALGEKLKADIDLVAVTKAEKASLVARLASPDSYKNAGIEYPFNNKFKFEMANRADGESYLKVESDQPINDPFVVMMVELNWASGRLVREYTFLLDPPNFVAEQPASAVVQVVAPVVTSPEPAIAAPQVVANTPVVTIAPVAASPVATPVPVEPTAQTEPVVDDTPIPALIKPQAVPVSTEKGKFDIATSKTGDVVAKTVPEGTYTVKRGDTLAKIASENIASGVSLERTIVALYRANLDQFDGKNMNRVSVGKLLKLPTDKELTHVKQAEAVSEIRAQADDWNSYRQKLAGAATPSSQAQSTQQVASGKINSSVADKAPIVKESAKEVLKLSKGDMPGDKAVPLVNGKAASAQDKKNAVQEDAIAQAKAVKEGQARTALLDKNLKDMERLAKLKVEAEALAQKTQPAVAPVQAAASNTVAAPSVAKTVVSADKVMPKETKAVTKPVSKPEPTLVDSLLAQPTYLAGGGAGLLGLLGLGWWLSRRKKTPAFEDIDENSEVENSRDEESNNDVVSTYDIKDANQQGALQSQIAEQFEDVDPISEADLFLNFGRDGQAEEILKEALLSTPENYQIHLKLLGIYANRKDLDSFERIAQQIKDSGDESVFKQASEMGRGIDPRNPLYGGSAALEDASSATMQAPAFGAPKASSVVNKPAGLDFDLGAEPTGQFDRSPEEFFLDSQDEPVNSVQVAEQVVLQPQNLDDLIFDVTGSHPTLQMGVSQAKQVEAIAEDQGMEFILDFPTVETVEKVASEIKAPMIDLAGISFNLDSEPDVGASVSKDNSDQWQEVNTKLDLAKAYHEMGDGVGAREILEEVLREGDTEQQKVAQSLIDSIH